MPATAVQHRVCTGVWEGQWHMITGCRVRPKPGCKSYRAGHRPVMLSVILILALTGLYMDRPIKVFI